MKFRTLIVAAALMLLSALAPARARELEAPASGPTPYPTRIADWPGAGEVRVFDWMTLNRREFWAERQAKQGSVVFAGDSLTDGWKTLDSDFGALAVAKRGIGGEVSRGLLFRFKEDVLDLNPRAIVILIGTNDLTASQDAAVTIFNIRAMLKLRQAQAPNAPVVLCTVPPSANPKAPVDARQQEALNRGLKALTKDYPGLFLVDLFAATANAAGGPEPRYFNEDLLHLSPAGYARWKQVLLPVLHQAGLL